MAVKPGQMLDRYKAIQEIGTGSFGGVWLAEDTWLNKRVALKIPHNQSIDFNKLLAEPKLLAALDHPNIIKLLTVEKTPEAMFLVMEFVEGKSLRERLNQGPIPVDEAVGIARAILDALAHAHQKGVVHRDLKPANILLTPQGQVKITDFGTAHALRSGEETVAAGTLFYMSKEQLLGRVLPASDLYSVGVILFEMLTGTLPFTDETGSKVIQKILSNMAAPDVHALNPAVPVGLASIVRRALDRDLDRRYKRAEEMLEALDAWKAGKPLPEAPAPVPLPHPAYDQFSRKVPRLSGALGVTHVFAYKAAYGSRGRGNGQFMLPTGVAMDGTGRLYISDAIRADIQILDRTGKYLRRMGSEGSIIEDGLKLLNPSALAVDRKNRTWVADTKNSRIMVAAENGEMDLQFGRPLVVVGLHDEQGTIGFNYPRGLALDLEEGLVYVADTGNNRLRLFNAEGVPVQTFGTRGDRPGEFNAPLGLAVGAAGRLYVADSQNYRIQIFDRGFRFLESFGKRGGGPGEFYHPPTHAAVTIHGEVLVCDDSDKMHVFSDAGKFIAYVAAPRAASPTPKYFSAAFSEGEDLYAVDENGCQVHHFVYKDKEKGL